MGKPPLPPPSSTNKRKKNNNNNYHSHELDAQTTVLGIVSQSPLGPRWSEEECVAFFNGLKEETGLRIRTASTYRTLIL
jgi:hypothetical protein